MILFPGDSPNKDHEGHCSAKNPAACNGELDYPTAVYIVHQASEIDKV